MRIIYTHIYNQLNTIDVKIVNNGDGFELSKYYPVFGRFGIPSDNSNGKNNKGCGKAQFYHYFEEVEIIGRGYDTNGNNKQYQRIHWKANEKDDLAVIEKDKETEIPDKTTIILKNFSEDLPKEQGKIIDNNFMLISKITSNNFSHRP